MKLTGWTLPWEAYVLILAAWLAGLAAGAYGAHLAHEREDQTAIEMLREEYDVRIGQGDLP